MFDLGHFLSLVSTPKENGQSAPSKSQYTMDLERDDVEVPETSDSISTYDKVKFGASVIPVILRSAFTYFYPGPIRSGWPFQFHLIFNLFKNVIRRTRDVEYSPDSLHSPGILAYQRFLVQM